MRLYGYKELEVVDEHGVKCELATLAENGRTVIGKGGTAMTYLTVDRLWCERMELRPVNLEGEVIEPVASSFAAPIKLGDTISIQDYLNHNIRLLYCLVPDSVPLKLLSKLQQGTIFCFEYSYRGGLEADTGFLLTNESGQIFFAVGDKSKVDFIGLQQSAAVASAESEGTDEDGLMDFDMI